MLTYRYMELLLRRSSHGRWESQRLFWGALPPHPPLDLERHDLTQIDIHWIYHALEKHYYSYMKFCSD